MTGNGSGKRGRPLGFKLSDYSRRAISESKRGQKHRPETRDKISRSLMIYFKRQNPLSEEIINRYIRMGNDELCDWINDVQDELDSTMDVLTEKNLRNKTKIEITCGHNIEFFSHSLTPELIYLIKEHCNIYGLEPEEFIGSVI